MNKKPVLDGYKKEGKKFTSPMKTMQGEFKEIHYVDRILPEIVWLQYLVNHLGKKEGIQVAIDFLKICHEQQAEGSPDPCFLTALNELDSEDWSKIVKRLEKDDLLEPVTGSLRSFATVYPEKNPLSSLIGDCEEPDDYDIDAAHEAVATLFSRYTKDSLLTQAIVLAYGFSVEKVKISSKVKFPELDKIESDFDSPEAQHAASFVRMSVNSSFSVGDQIDSSWAEYFWNRCGELTTFESDDKDSEPDYTNLHPFEAFAYRFSDRVDEVRESIWTALPIDYYQSETYEVIGGLLARQCSLAKKLCNPSIWDYESGPLFLRALVDNYITLAWILKDPVNRSQKFIDYGLGQEKLQIEHLKSELEAMPDSDQKKDLQDSIEARVVWLNDQHWEFLQDVNVGSWAGVSTRDMAQEADCLDLYRFAYGPWSQAAHGTWNHVSRFNTRRSNAPLKKHIFCPTETRSQDFGVMMNGCKYLEMFFNAFVDFYELKIEWESLYDWTHEESYKVVEALKTYQAKQ